MLIWISDRTSKLPEFNQRYQMQGPEPCCNSKLVGRYDFLSCTYESVQESPSPGWPSKIWWKSAQDVHPNLITYNGFMDVCQKTGEWRVAVAQLMEDGAPNIDLLFFSSHTPIIKGHVESDHSKCGGIWIAPLIYNKTPQVLKISFFARFLELIALPTIRSSLHVKPRVSWW